MTKKTVTILSIIGILSFCIILGYLWYGYRPEQENALIEKPLVAKHDALKRAQGFLQQFGLDTKNYPVKNISYMSRNREILYLLKDFGYKETRQLIEKEKIPYAFWSIRLSGVSGESVRLDIDGSDGSVVNYNFWKEPSPDEKITNLKEQEARELVEKFLLAQGLDTAKLELANVNKNTRNIQDEYYFKWLKKDARYQEASYVVHASVKADKITGYSRGLQLPEKYKYEYENSLFLSKVWIGLSGGLSFVCGLILIVLAIVRRRSLNWKLARAWAGILGIVFMIQSFNEQSNYVFYLDMLFKLIGVAFFSLIMFVMVPVADSLFRESFKKEMFLKKHKEANIFASGIFCYCLTFVSFIAVGLTFGLLSRFKITWDVGSGPILSEIVTSQCVYLAPFLIGIIPAFTEEFFRGFIMAFSRKACKSTLAAILISAFIWGFGHTVIDGSFYPGYIAGLEKFIHGILVGYILLYFGIEVAIFWHFLNNFLAANACLFYLGQKYMVYSFGMSFIIVIPFIAAMYFYFKRLPALSQNIHA